MLARLFRATEAIGNYMDTVEVDSLSIAEEAIGETEDLIHEPLAQTFNGKTSSG